MSADEKKFIGIKKENVMASINEVKQLINNSNEDKEYALKLIEELIMNGYFILGLPMEDGSIFKFSEINE